MEADMMVRVLSSLVIAFAVVLVIPWLGPVATEAQTDCQPPAAADTQSFSGTGPSVTEPFVVESAILTMSATHEGTANFIVHAIGEDGSEDYVFNEIGSFSGQAALQLAPGVPTILEVDADGPWQLSIAPSF
jgi:hypothetical protein